MATNLTVRNVDEEIVRSLQEQAVQNGRSTEAEHRAILLEVLTRQRKKPFNEVLASMPNVGLDADFDRHYQD
jgi:plasmid stability protein